MTHIKAKNTIKSKQNSLAELQKKLALLRINIRAGREKNTNAHKSIKKQITQELTKSLINNNP